MVKQGYTKAFACAVTAAGSIIGPTIPPSTLMVIYGSIMGVSIAGLFVAKINEATGWSLSGEMVGMGNLVFCALMFVIFSLAIPDREPITEPA